MAEKKNKTGKESSGKKSKETKTGKAKPAPAKEVPPEYEYKRLQRSRSNKMIAGICGGLAEYFAIDPTIVRVLVVVSCLITGGAIFLAYLIGWIFIPENLSDTPASSKPIGPYVGIILGIFLVLAGMGMVFDQMRYWMWVPSWIQPIFSVRSIFALSLIVGGVMLIVHLMRKDENGVRIFTKPENAKVASSFAEPGKRQLFRSTTDKKLSGVCGGIAEYFTIDPTLVRILWVVGTLISQVLPGIIVYVAMAYIVPDRPSEQEKTS